MSAYVVVAFSCNTVADFIHYGCTPWLAPMVSAGVKFIENTKFVNFLHNNPLTIATICYHIIIDNSISSCTPVLLQTMVVLDLRHELHFKSTLTVPWPLGPHTWIPEISVGFVCHIPSLASTSVQQEQQQQQHIRFRPHLRGGKTNFREEEIERENQELRVRGVRYFRQCFTTSVSVSQFPVSCLHRVGNWWAVSVTSTMHSAQVIHLCRSWVTAMQYVAD